MKNYIKLAINIRKNRQYTSGFLSYINNGMISLENKSKYFILGYADAQLTISKDNNKFNTDVNPNHK